MQSTTGNSISDLVAAVLTPQSNHSTMHCSVSKAMTNKLEIPRLLAWRLAGLDPDYTTAQLDADEEELRALLANTDAGITASVATPVIERQPDAIIEGVMTSVGITHAIYASTVSLKDKEQVKLYAERPAPVAVPEGWKLVPIEPTELMIRRGDQNYSWSVAKIYKAMIEDAPACLDKVKELNQ